MHDSEEEDETSSSNQQSTRRIKRSSYCCCLSSPGRLNRLCGLCPSSRPASLSANACAAVLGFGPFNFLGVDCFRFKMSCLFSKYRRLLTSLMWPEFMTCLRKRLNAASPFSPSPTLISVWNAPLNAKATPGADFCFGCCATVKFREREREVSVLFRRKVKKESFCSSFILKRKGREEEEDDDEDRMFRFLRLPNSHVLRVQPHTRPRNRRYTVISGCENTISEDSCTQKPLPALTPLHTVNAREAKSLSASLF